MTEAGQEHTELGGLLRTGQREHQVSGEGGDRVGDNVVAGYLAGGEHRTGQRVRILASFGLGLQLGVVLIWAGKPGCAHPERP